MLNQNPAQKRMLDNYRKAQRLRSARKRSEEAVRSAREKRLNERVRVAEARTRYGAELPQGYLQNYLAMATRKAATALAPHIERHMMDIDRRAQEYEDAMLIRSRDGGYVRAHENLETGDQVLTVSFPEFNWTHVFDPAMRQSLIGSRGPIFMPDETIYYTEGVPLSRPLGPNDHVQQTVVKSL